MILAARNDRAVLHRMRFLIIDESGESRRLLAQMLRERWPEARTDKWDPVRQGDPAAVLTRERFDLILLDLHASAGNGIAWVAQFGSLPHAAPVVLIADHGDTQTGIQALKAGAADVLRKTGLTPQRLSRAVEDALREQEARRQEQSGARSTFVRTIPVEALKRGAAVQENAGRIPGYRTLRKIGAGGMAQVYLAERVHDGMQMVLKVLDPALRRDATFLQRFVREYKLIAAIENEHVAHIFDQGFSGDQPYIAMEYLEGGTLAARMHEGMSSLAALRLTAQIAKALDAIHAHGIVHRDLKPQNIMFRASGRPVIVDFGLAKELDSASNLTRYGALVTTPRYMSPEQCTGSAVDARSDLYSLGVIFHEMLTGERLWGDAGPAELVRMHIQGEIPRLPERLVGYQTIIDRLLAKKPEHRFQSARELFATIAI